MKTSLFDTQFSVVCLPENPSLFMMNMQVFHIERHPSADHAEKQKTPEAIVWCAVFQRPVIKKL